MSWGCVTAHLAVVQGCYDVAAATLHVGPLQQCWRAAPQTAPPPHEPAPGVMANSSDYIMFVDQKRPRYIFYVVSKYECVGGSTVGRANVCGPGRWVGERQVAAGRPPSPHLNIPLPTKANRQQAPTCSSDVISVEAVFSCIDKSQQLMLMAIVFQGFLSRAFEVKVGHAGASPPLVSQLIYVRKSRIFDTQRKFT